MPNSEAPWLESLKILVKQMEDNVKAIKELGQVNHELNRFVDKIPYQFELKLNSAISKLKEELEADAREEIQILGNKIAGLEAEMKLIQYKVSAWGFLGTALGAAAAWLVMFLLRN